MIDLASAAKYVTAIGVICGATITAETRYAPASSVGELRSELRVDRIFDLANQARANGSPDWLCDAMERELATLCSDEPSNYLCGSDARRELKAKAGC